MHSASGSAGTEGATTVKPRHFASTPGEKRWPSRLSPSPSSGTRSAGREWACCQVASVAVEVDYYGHSASLWLLARALRGRNLRQNPVRPLAWPAHSLMGRRGGAQGACAAQRWQRLLKKCMAGGVVCCEMRSSLGPIRMLAALRCRGDGRILVFRVSSVGVAEGERGPAMRVIVASTLVVTGVAALVAGGATGARPPLVVSLFESAPLPPTSKGAICLASRGPILPSTLSAANRTLLVSTESAALVGSGVCSWLVWRRWQWRRSGSLWWREPHGPPFFFFLRPFFFPAGPVPFFFFPAALFFFLRVRSRPFFFPATLFLFPAGPGGLGRRGAGAGEALGRRRSVWLDSGAPGGGREALERPRWPKMAPDAPSWPPRRCKKAQDGSRQLPRCLQVGNALGRRQSVPARFWRARGEGQHNCSTQHPILNSIHLQHNIQYSTVPVSNTAPSTQQHPAARENP